jgi:hypothetical protein
LESTELATHGLYLEATDGPDVPVMR